MNIDWDQELAEFFNNKYLTSWRKIHEGKYEFVSLEHHRIIFTCSEEGYRCLCHDQTYELPHALLRYHSPKYVEAFNAELFSKLQDLSEQREEDA